MDYDVTIGLEIHIQLKTRRKVFAPSGYTFAAPPNSLTDPVVLGLPGTLPVINKEAVLQCARLGLMLGCDIAPRCKWDRKNYFYPDNSKNYQLSQYDEPLCLGGEVQIELPGPGVGKQGPMDSVTIERIHLEEDPGKLTHTAHLTEIDFNRCGVALAEIVTTPCLTHADQAVAFLQALRLLATYAGISDCDMEKGQMRCDANVSLKPKGSAKLGTRTETKNLNSTRNVKAAIESEIRRQKQVLLGGGHIVQETLRWDAERGQSISLRSKEDAHDYRYFPDPDLLPVELSEDLVHELAKALPERPYHKQARYIKELSLPYATANVLISDAALPPYFEAAYAATGPDPKLAKPLANLIVNNLLAAVAESSQSIENCPVAPKSLAELVLAVDKGLVLKDAALKQVFPEMFSTGEGAMAVTERLGLKIDPEADGGNEELAQLCQSLVKDPKFSKAVQQYLAGNEKAINALMGPVMKATQGRANPPQVLSMLKQAARKAE
jgi:aspartyl-tRNA(Asn)/glutamyl-tRNA(Gln) amidotransferase subunit B